MANKLETPITSRKRKIKTTLSQYELYIEMLESNPYFRENKVTPDHPNDVSECWDKLLKNLNASGGPQKTLTEWKRVFTDWKSQVRKRARLIKNSSKETGNKGEPEKDLTEIEKKVLYLTGDIVVEGVGGVPELGLANEQNLEKALDEEKKEDAEEKQVKQTITRAKKTSETSILMEISSNLEKMVQLKKEEVALKRLELKLKYNITGEVGDIIADEGTPKK